MSSFSFIELSPKAIWDIIKVTGFFIWIILKMIWPYILFIIAIDIVFTFLSIKIKSKKAGLPYCKKEYLMTKAEHEFFKVLQEVVQDKYYIVPQVQLSNLVQVEKQERWEYTYRNKINRKSVDFVLFNKEYFTPRLVIELDDSSHLRENRRTRDNFLDEVLNKVGLKIVHIKTAHRYNINEILNLLV